MESQEQKAKDVPVEMNAGTDPNPTTQSIDINEVAHAAVRPVGAAASKNPPQIPLAPMKRVQARFNPLADVVMYLVVFAGGFFGVGCRRALDLLMPSIDGTPFVIGTFVSNMVACFLFAMLVEYMSAASWLRRRVRQAVSRGVGLGFLGGFSTMSGVMLETMEGLHERHFVAAFGYLAGSFICGLIAAAIGMALMRVAMAHGIRKRVRGAIAEVNASVSDSGESDTQDGAYAFQMSDSPESDALGAPVGVRHVKVADVAHSAAQAAREAAQTAQQAAQAAQVAAQTGQMPQVSSPQSQEGRKAASSERIASVSPVQADQSSPNSRSSQQTAYSAVYSVAQPAQSSPNGQYAWNETHQSQSSPDSRTEVEPYTPRISHVSQLGVSHLNVPKLDVLQLSNAQSPDLPSPQNAEDPQQSSNLPSFEPKPITAQIPLVADPTTGEVH